MMWVKGRWANILDGKFLPARPYRQETGMAGLWRTSGVAGVEAMRLEREATDHKQVSSAGIWIPEDHRPREV